MKTKHAALALAMFTLHLAGAAPSAAAETAPGKCALKELASLPITVTANGMISVPVKINGSEEQFVAALGHPYTAVTSGLAHKQGLIVHQTGSSFISYMGGSSSYVAYIPTIGVGQVTMSNDQALVLLAPSEGGASGVLGDDFFSKFDVELNLKAGALKLFSPEHCPGNVVYWGRAYTVLPMNFDSQGVPEFAMQLDGKPVSVKLMTIDQEAMMTGASAKELFGIAPSPTPPGKPERLLDIMEHGLSVSNAAPLSEHSFNELTLEGVTIKDLKAAIGPDTGPSPCHGERKFLVPGYVTHCYGGIDLMLGRNELSRLRLYFAFQEKALYVTGADPDVAPAQSLATDGNTSSPAN